MAIAPMGYIGMVKLFGTIARVSSCSLNTRQAIEHPDVIDGTVDWTLYQLRGIETEGDARLPIMSEGGTSLGQLFDLATVRDQTGELIQQGDSTVVVSYGKAQVRTFQGCKINTFEMRATAGESVEGTLGIWGTTVVIGSGTISPVSGKPVRVLAWADIRIDGTSVGQGCDIKEFSMTVANNLQRNYTFCPSSGYFPNNISTGKRNISGSLGFQGFAPTEIDQADKNKDKIHPDAALHIVVGGLTGPVNFDKSFNNIVYEYQTIEAQPSVITSTVNWYAHADGGGVAFS